VRSKKTFFFFIFLFVLIKAVASPDSLIIKNGSGEQSPLFIFSAGYRVPINKNTIINSGHGFYLEGGINPGRYVSKKSVIGFYVGLAWKDGLWSTAFNSDFANDYKLSMNPENNFTGLDSAVISSSKDLFLNKKGRSFQPPGCEMKSFHNYSMYYGTILKLPYKNIPALKLYMGTTRSHYQGPGNIATQQKDYNIFQLRRAMYGCELILMNSFQIKKHKYHGNIGIYYETCNIYNASLYFDDGDNINIPLKNFMTASFLEKYKKEVSWGLKISYSIL